MMVKPQALGEYETMRLQKLSLDQVKLIYNERMLFDFPDDERKPLNMIVKALSQGSYECLGLFDDQHLVGYAFLVKDENDYLVDYLAVYPEHRNKGIGGELLHLLEESLRDADNIIIEVEDPDAAAEDAEKETRIRRKSFYMRNGCQDTGLKVECFGVIYLILTLGSTSCGNLLDLYLSFYRKMLPKAMFEKNVRGIEG